jgi:hypothetical protein
VSVSGDASTLSPTDTDADADTDTDTDTDADALSYDAADLAVDDALACSGPATPPPSTCAAGPLEGEECNPVCQTGCACGTCVLVEGHAKCRQSAGSGKTGELCDPQASNPCAPGLACLAEPCLTNQGRCYKLCASANQCDGQACTIDIYDQAGSQTRYTACDVAPQGCDPIANTGCPAAGLACFAVTGSTLCDCPSRAGPVHSACALYSDCLPGLICVSSGPTPTCEILCRVSRPSCPSRSVCVPTASGSDLGFCSTM